MKIIEPSAMIIEDELSQLSIYQRIAYCAGVCYQREPRKTEEEAQAFCRKMMKIGHMSTLEMAVVHLVCPAYDVPLSDFLKFEMLNSYKYTKDTYDGPSMYVVTGSIRSFIEAGKSFDIEAFMAGEFQLLFDVPEGSIDDFDSMDGIRFASNYEIPWQHKHVAVRFVVNRAVSHELVRHRPMSFLQESQRYCRYEDEVVFITPGWYRKGDQERIWEQAVEDAEDFYKTLLHSGLKPQQARAVLPNSTKTELIAYASLPQWKHIFKLRCSPAADPEMRRVMIPLEQEFKGKYPEAFSA